MSQCLPLKINAKRKSLLLSHSYPDLYDSNTKFLHSPSRTHSLTLTQTLTISNHTPSHTHSLSHTLSHTLTHFLLPLLTPPHPSPPPTHTHSLYVILAKSQQRKPTGALARSIVVRNISCILCLTWIIFLCAALRITCI